MEVIAVKNLKVLKINEFYAIPATILISRDLSVKSEASDKWWFSWKNDPTQPIIILINQNKIIKHWQPPLTLLDYIRIIEESIVAMTEPSLYG